MEYVLDEYVESQKYTIDQNFVCIVKLKKNIDIKINNILYRAIISFKIDPLNGKVVLATGIAGEVVCVMVEFIDNKIQIMYNQKENHIQIYT